MGSSPFSLSAEDWKKIGKGALIALGGALLTWGADSLLPDLKEKGLIDAAMFVFFSTLINAARKWWLDTRIVVALLLCSLASAASAADLVDLGPHPDGEHTFKVVYKDGQIVSVTGPFRVVKLGQPLPPPVTPPPTTPFVLEVRKLTQAALDGGASKTTGAGISSAYSLVSDGVSDGSIPLDKTWDALKLASDTVVNSQADGVRWATFRIELGKLLTTARNNNELVTKAQVAAKLREVAGGMNLATGFGGNPRQVAQVDPRTAGILDGIDIAKLIELIKMVLELIKLFKP